ncbi:hypothetical protein ACRE_010730 [Hapsidospora chrysogenum ATCC 11550]|uniref:Uncharacterized protein n=1 Tax=Hapsidospora chrysogenum (strain ATCC 11550 / CBS 779.69 / DSM 880 / IAM 14645 / JCM 23072 / IMI 49137) TaxID=857340 RepID=A0A086TFI2_HAPC1|nr:hypothetical protein ACRE_010730 [Hapsidospora chrysogenum ATCC 11550]
MQSLDEWLCEQMDRIRTGDYEDPLGDQNHQDADPTLAGPDLPSGRSGRAYQVDDTDFSHLSEHTICADETAGGDQESDGPDLSFGRSETPSDDDEDSVDGLDRVHPIEQTQTNPVAAVDRSLGGPDQPSRPSPARYNHNDMDSLFGLETIQGDEEAAANQPLDAPDPSPSQEQPQPQVDNREGSKRRSEETILLRQTRRQRVSAARERLEELEDKLKALREQLGKLRAIGYGDLNANSGGQ